jgi:hypothetical protein
MNRFVPDFRPLVPRILRASLFLLLGALPALRAAEGNEEITAVSARAAKDYVRVKLPNGTYQPETYAFGEGGHWGGATADDTADKLKFLDVARVISVPLAHENYLPSKDPNKTRLLIMVYWGVTTGTTGTGDSVAYQQLQNAGAGYQSAMAATKDALGNTSPIANTYAAIEPHNQLNEALAAASLVNQQRDQRDFQNAQMLGYGSEGLIGTEFGQSLEGTPLAHQRDELISEIEANRYFVVLMAYDFQALWKQKKHKELWETRFSIRQLRHDFGDELPSIAMFASQYFGQDTKGLVRKPVPIGHVNIGEATTIDYVPAR